MREFRTRAIINATAFDVFRVLTDAASYSQFDPNCERIEGRIEQGQQIYFVTKPANSRKKILISEVSQDLLLMRWEFGLPFQLLKSVRSFSVIAKDDQTTEVQLLEIQGGYFFKFLMKNMPDQSIMLQQFAKGLKNFIESRP